MTTISLVAYLDVYGFSALVAQATSTRHADASTKISDIEIRLGDCFEQINENSQSLKFDFFGISDCVFLVRDLDLSSHSTAIKSLSAAKDAIRLALAVFASRGFDVRGGVAIGKVTRTGTNILLGDPVIRAVRIEGSFRAPLVCLPVAELSKVSDLQRNAVDTVFCEPTVIVKTTSAGRTRAHVFPPHGAAALGADYRVKLEQYYCEGPPNVALGYEEALEILDQLKPDNT